MCVIAAKYFPKTGWIGVKNRDRNYTPEVSFTSFQSDDTERLLMHDDITGYREGLNNHGVAILSASLMVSNDEKEITKNSSEDSPDGVRIGRALMLDSARSAAAECVKLKLTGSSIVFDRDELYLIEACVRDDEYHHTIHRIPKNHTVVRTNHGIWLPWAGYQFGVDRNQTLSRISSMARYLQAAAITKAAKTPQQLIDGLCQVYVQSPQLNVLRVADGRKRMRTTMQEMLIPSQRTMYVRPVNSHVIFDVWNLNKPNKECWVEMLSNRALRDATQLVKMQ